MATGIPSSSTYLTITRNKMIEMAHGMIGILEPGQPMPGDMLKTGIDVLTNIVREVDVAGKWRWTIEDSAHVPLVGGQYVYGIDSGLPGNISELLTASYRDANGNDTPIDVVKAEKWEMIPNKIQVGVPRLVYLTENMDLSQRKLYVWPTLSETYEQSEVEGPYRCILTHTSTATSEPVNGVNWRIFWEPGGEGGAPWEVGEDYTSPPQIRLQCRRPIIDFLTASTAPDFPMPWPRLLTLKLASDLGDFYGIPVAERRLMIDKAKGAYNDIYNTVKAKSNTLHNKARYF